ncbi:MAG: phosphoglucomutase/phosphomannomutase family protein [Eubacteriales bacterium]|nr:phosphoglucomutase/phosphomannomutase family protein [Eubacteriales bacterium]
MIKFGTGGWRAIIADEFTKANIRLVAAGLARLALEEGYEGQQICVGYDRRFLSKEAAHWAAEVLVGYGFRPFIVARSSPTPLIMFTTKSMNLPYGMAVTASHNPAIYNGIKLFTRGGRDADVTVTRKIEEKIAALEGTEVPWVDYDEAVADGRITEGYPVNEYIDSILDAVDVYAIKRSRPRIAIDPMFGVSQSCLRTILLTCRCDVDVIHEQHDTLFGGKMPAPDRETLKQLQHFVVDNKCDLGIATDGDADRLGVIDERGSYVHPNTLLLLLYYYLLKYRGWTGPCVRNNSTTHLLDRVAQGMGQVCYEVPVGFKHISAKMTETNAIIGGESSGGMAVRGHISGKDGIYAAALLVEMLAVTGKSLSALYREITDQYGELFYEEASYTMHPAKKAELQTLIFEQKQYPAFGQEIDHISREDGCKVYFADGSWVICRFSGTEPLLRFSAEAQTPDRAREYMGAWKAFLGL